MVLPHRAFIEFWVVSLSNSEQPSSLCFGKIIIVSTTSEPTATVISGNRNFIRLRDPLVQMIQCQANILRESREKLDHREAFSFGNGIM